MAEKFERWQGTVAAEELAVYAKAGFGRKIGFGQKAALLNVDTTYMFVDPSYDMCGRKMPELEQALVALTQTFRRLQLPIYYSRRDNRSHPTYRGIWNLKLGTADTFQYKNDPKADDWPTVYRPRPEDRIILKNKPSPFFATPLDAFLRYDGVDTLVVVGVSTSGCVRAAVGDAFSHNFRVIVVEEACADRSASAHRANLFDMDMKFADVENLESVLLELDRHYGSTVGKPIMTLAGGEGI
jgi:maleamate amidohydrolase